METDRKPMSVERAEFLAKIYDAINNAKLPAFVIEYALKDVFEQIQSVAKNQCEQEMRYYLDSKQNETEEATDE